MGVLLLLQIWYSITNITYDLSKFSPTEFLESIKFYQGGKSSPIPAAKKAQGYSLAWQHHKGRNKHHYEYWTDNYDLGTTCIKMPYKYVLELVADYLAAGRTYRGKNFTFVDEYEWWMKCKDYRKIHEDTKQLITKMLYMLAYRKDANEVFKIYKNLNTNNFIY